MIELRTFSAGIGEKHKGGVEETGQLQWATDQVNLVLSLEQKFIF
jgi:hypothetical protein